MARRKNSLAARSVFILIAILAVGLALALVAFSASTDNRSKAAVTPACGRVVSRPAPNFRKFSNSNQEFTVEYTPEVIPNAHAIGAVAVFDDNNGKYTVKPEAVVGAAAKAVFQTGCKGAANGYYDVCSGSGKGLTVTATGKSTDATAALSQVKFTFKRPDTNKKTIDFTSLNFRYLYDCPVTASPGSTAGRFSVAIQQTAEQIQNRIPEFNTIGFSTIITEPDGTRGLSREGFSIDATLTDARQTVVEHYVGRPDGDPWYFSFHKPATAGSYWLTVTARCVVSDTGTHTACQDRYPNNYGGTTAFTSMRIQVVGSTDTCSPMPTCRAGQRLVMQTTRNAGDGVNSSCLIYSCVTDANCPIPQVQCALRFNGYNANGCAQYVCQH